MLTVTRSQLLKSTSDVYVITIIIETAVNQTSARRQQTANKVLSAVTI